VHSDFERCYRAVAARDDRFDGWFFTAVTSTGIYCRPSCPAVRPQRRNVRFYPTAAAAQHGGFRACKRCRPDAVPGSPEWNLRADVVARAMRLIADGVVDREGVSGLAARLGYSERHLGRQLTAEVGAGPLALARAQRAQTARVLVERTALPLSQVAFAAGFASVRQFNTTIREVFATTPSGLRAAARPHPPAAGTLALRLPYRRPLDSARLLRFLSDRAVAGVEDASGNRYRRTLLLPHGPAVVDLTPADGHVLCRLTLEDFRDLTAAVQRCRRLLDLDADPTGVAEALHDDPALRPALRAHPGLRVPGTPDGDELAVRAVLGQQVSVAGARTVAGRLVRRLGKPLTAADGALTHLFPTAEMLAEADPADLPLPASRRRALTTLTTALADGSIVLDPGAERAEVTHRLLALPGVGPWTAEYIAMRALGDPDAFPATDLGLTRGAAALGLPSTPKALQAHAERWRPWRAYAAEHLWAAPTTPANTRSTG
jgi:AraC family transcriptional regulator of adaptative response / DNA-3-methyladenine glycosylase II